MFITSIGNGECMHANTFFRERSAARIQLISDVCDLAAPLSAVGILNLDDGIVGITGTISSLIGVWSQWRKTAGPA